MTVREVEKIKEAGEELGKSLSKVLHSEKYKDFHGDYTNLIEIIAVASNTAIRIIEEKVAVRESL